LPFAPYSNWSPLSSRIWPLPAASQVYVEVLLSLLSWRLRRKPSPLNVSVVVSPFCVAELSWFSAFQLNVAPTPLFAWLPLAS